MPTVDVTLLSGADNGFTLLSQSGFDSASVSGHRLVAVKNPATPATPLGADFQQGATTNKYSDLGVPAGATVTAIKLLGAVAVVTLGSTASGQAQFYTNEADLGLFDVNSIGEGPSTSLSKTADDYVRFLVSILGNVEFDETESYGTFEVQLYAIQVQITYSEPDVIQTDNSSVSDSRSVEGNVTNTDNSSVSDALSVDGNVTNAENVSISDSISIEATVTFADNVSVSDTLTSEGTVSVSDNSSTGEVLTQLDITAGDSQLQTDSVNISESMSVEGISIQFDDSVQIGDAFSVEGQVVASDSARITDAQSYEASLTAQSNTFIDESQNPYYL